MDSLDVRIVELGPMRVARFHAFGSSPELEAMRKLLAWAEPRGLLCVPGSHRVFGFNNPDPSPGSPNYGYEFWIELGPDLETGGDVVVREFAGGLYAVTECIVSGDPYDEIPMAWRRLAAWVENSRYQWATHQWLEEHLSLAGSPTIHLELHCPISDPSR